MSQVNHHNEKGHQLPIDGMMKNCTIIADYKLKTEN